MPTPVPSASAGAVTVVIPTRNRRLLAVSAVIDALAQVDVEVEVVVVDDGSTDGTADAVAAISDARVRLLCHAETAGPAATRNDGFRAARTDWVAFHDDDDLWAPGKLAAQLHALQERPGARWSATASVDVDADLTVTAAVRLQVDDLQVALLHENLIPAGSSSVVVARDLLEELGGFDVALEGSEDWDLWLRLAGVSPIAYVDRPLVAYRRWDGSASYDLGRMHETRDRVMARHGADRSAEEVRRQDARWAGHAARVEVLTGHRFRAARWYVEAALRSRAPGQLIYAGVVVVAPAMVRRRLEGLNRATLPAGWEAEVGKWLPAET